MILVGFIFLVNIMGPERCYQWENREEFIDKYYKSLKRNDQQENVVNSLIENLEKDLWAIEVKKKADKPFQKKSDAKDALYYMDL